VWTIPAGVDGTTSFYCRPNLLTSARAGGDPGELPGSFAEFTLSGQSEILRFAQNDSEGLRMTAKALRMTVGVLTLSF
jgi:hypothetical protein